MAVGAERGDGTFASLGAEGCFVPGLSHDCEQSTNFGRSLFLHQEVEGTLVKLLESHK